MDLLHTFAPFDRVSRWASPVRVAFFASLALSFLAVLSNPSLNRDGMLYIDSARMFLSDGLAGASTVFNWPFLPILIAGFSELSGLGLENAALLLNALFLAGACSLLVACATRRFPEAAWPICLCLLALPGMNQYRNEILREYGCWFFFMLSFWLALRWSERPQWRSALAYSDDAHSRRIIPPRSHSLLRRLDAVAVVRRTRWPAMAARCDDRRPSARCSCRSRAALSRRTTRIR
jgi:hypothetical protein